MAGHWKITVAKESVHSCTGERLVVAQRADAEDAELERLSKGATRVARESMRLIDAKKAELCRKQMLKDILTAR